jgi:hypothetical protein
MFSERSITGNKDRHTTQTNLYFTDFGYVLYNEGLKISYVNYINFNSLIIDVRAVY